MRTVSLAIVLMGMLSITQGFLIAGDDEDRSWEESTSAPEESFDESGGADSQESTTEAASAVTPAPSTQVSPSSDFIDTIDIGAEGNWLRKRHIYEQAQALYERIKNRTDAVLDTRLSFFVKRTSLDREVLDPFYLSIGLDRGELKEAIDSLIQNLSMLQSKGYLDEHEESLLDLLQKEKGALEELQKNIDTVLTLDHNIDDALMTLQGEMDRARGYQTDAWNSYKSIAKELSDKKAEEIYVSMQTIESNIAAIEEYIQGAFNTHFNYLAKQIQDQTEKVKNAVAYLQTRDIDLKKQVQQVDERAEKERLEKAREAAAQKALEEEEAEREANMSWFGKIVRSIKGGIAATWHFIADSVRDVSNWFARLLGFGGQSSDDEEASEPAEEATPATPDQSSQVTTPEEAQTPSQPATTPDQEAQAADNAQEPAQQETSADESEQGPATENNDLQPQQTSGEEESAIMPAPEVMQESAADEAK